MAIPSLTIPQTNSSGFNTNSLLNGNGPTMNLGQTSTPAVTPTQPVTTPAAPSYEGIKGIFLNQDSPLNLQNIGSTLGMIAPDVIAGALAPETGGLSLLGVALPALGGGVGGALGKAAQNIGTGQNVGSGVIGAGEQGVLSGAASPFIGKALGGITGALGNKLLGEGEDAATAGLGISQANRNSFFKNTGQTVADFLNSHGLLGQNQEGFNAAHDALQGAYNDIARNSGVKVAPKNILSSLQDELQNHESITPLGASSQNIAKNTMDTMLNNLPKDANGNIDIGDLTNAKQAIQAQTNFNPTNPEIPRANTIVSNAMRNAVNSAADPTGKLGLEGIGQELNKFKTLGDMIGSKEPNQVGGTTISKLLNRKTLPYLGGVAGGGVGTLVGNPVAGAGIGSVLGEGLSMAADSPAAMQATSKALTGAGTALQTPVSQVASLAAGIPASLAKNYLIQQTGNAMNPNATPTPSLNLSSTNPAAPATASADQNPMQSGIEALQNGGSLDTAQYTALMDTMGINPNLGRWITSAYQAGNPAQTQALARSQGAVDILGNLYNQAGGAKGNIAGSIENALGNTGLVAPSVKAYNDQKSGLGQEIISQLYPGGASASQANMIMQALPNINDLPQTAATKLATLKATINNIIASQQGATPTSVAASSSPSLNLGQ